MTKFQSFLEVKGITSEEFNGKSAEEMAGLYNEYNEKAQSDLTDAIEAKASKEDIDTLKAELTNNQTEQVKALNATLKSADSAVVP